MGSDRPFQLFSVSSTCGVVGAGWVSSSPEGTASEAGAWLSDWEEGAAVLVAAFCPPQPPSSRTRQSAAQHPAAPARDQM